MNLIPIFINSIKINIFLFIPFKSKSTHSNSHPRLLLIIFNLIDLIRYKVIFHAFMLLKLD